MQRLLAGKHASINLVVRGRHEGSGSALPRVGLRHEDVLCLLKREGSGAFHVKELCPATWKDLGHGIYQLELEPDEFADCDQFTIVVQGQPKLAPAIEPQVLTFEIVEERPKGRPPTPMTVICGEIVTLDERPRAKIQVTLRVTQCPLIVGGRLVVNEVVTLETDAEGRFEVAVPTGALITVQIPATGYTRQFVVPPPPAVGIPVNLFML